MRTVMPKWFIDNKAAGGAILTGAGTVAGAIAGRDTVPQAIFSINLIALVCFGICALLRYEFTRQTINPARWRRYVVVGMVFAGLTVASQVGVTSWHVYLTWGRWTSLFLAGSVIMTTAGLISRYYILPNVIAMRAGYQLGLHHRESLCDFVDGDLRLAEDVLRVMNRAGSGNGNGN